MRDESSARRHRLRGADYGDLYKKVINERRLQSAEKASEHSAHQSRNEKTASEKTEAFANYKYRYPVETSRLDARFGDASLNSTTTGIHDKLLLRYRLDLLSNIIEDGIYWSERLESLMPKGFGADDDLAWIKLVNTSTVVGLREGCGRMQNRLVMFEDANMSCARHRQNIDQIQGELFSFHLGRIIGISNLVPSTISFARDAIWSKVRDQIRTAKWNVNRPMVLTQFIDDLLPAYIPAIFRTRDRRLHPVQEDLASRQESDLIELMQWSDLIVFDYLTANLDRIVNNLFNQRWNREMMNKPAHNLLRSRKNGLLLFIDNESGLLHGYRLLNEYETFHRSLLDSLCVFRKKTADFVELLHKKGNVSNLLRDAAYKNGLDYQSVPFLPEKNLRLLKHRIATVYKRIRFCKSLYSPRFDEINSNER
ncbi:protein four-jointed-like protein [Dinothrombium tinctorium]|uniref:Protein four-jointed-like protein n=1 Tax=Dinothrombium tinctorium TaxID=1965070 RepID=A0A443RHA8_9ACAR|nr:protein four-jointed-like protein [Dinothrombium tinctorium]